MMLRAFAHIHSIASRDSILTHEEIRAAAVARGVGAVLITEHQEALNERSAAVAAARCRDLSDHQVVLVPGMEISSEERWHVLAFGVEGIVPKAPAVVLADRIREAGGVPVLAHPTRYKSGWQGSLPGIGAVEVWNRHYDGRVAPPPEVVAAWRGAEGVRAFVGLDAHGPEAFSGPLPEMLVRARVPTEEAVIEALREGAFECGVDGKPFDPAKRGIREWAGESYRSLRRAARRIGYTLPVSEETRRRIGRRW